MIFCEGRRSEPEYIAAIKRISEVAARAAINIVIDVSQGVPLTLVRNAVERKRDPEIDECWCVFDVEWPRNHPNLKQAISLARDHGIGVAISNPCFELWLILHFEGLSRFSENAAVERRSKELDGRAGKGIDAALYMPRRKDAVRRARELAARHERNGVVFPHDNPSSSMADLLAAIDPDLGEQESARDRPDT
ncbi:RloB family protein [Parafrankia elaeagni]|uniref:RloB family protein n=1 Tax=Parafrankia elaeagni TaxID=222534 RepID=UPI00036D3277|nr:RloB family protein [Parafrankia elaeagni]